MATKAWHLRQDGKAFPVDVHLYCMKDDDLSSEAETASFIIKTNSKDKDLAMHVLDAWMALMIEDEVDFDAEAEDICYAIKEAVASNEDLAHYHASYKLSIEELLEIHNSCNNYSDVDTLYEFTDSIRAKMSQIQTDIAHSLNQQFCRVRFGGKYDSELGNNGIWFRISSTYYNWNNTIYSFVAEMRKKLHIETITICRDLESDMGYNKNSKDYFYRSKDRTLYYDMDVQEFLSEEHETSPVFSSAQLNQGVLATIRLELSKGDTLHGIFCKLHDAGVNTSRIYTCRHDLWKKLLETDISECDVVDVDAESKLREVSGMILRRYPKIDVIQLDYDSESNEVICTVESSIEKIDHLQIRCPLQSTRDTISSASEGTIATLIENALNRYL